MKQPSFCGQELLSISVIEAAGFAEPAAKVYRNRLIVPLEMADMIKMAHKAMILLPVRLLSANGKGNADAETL